MAICIECRREVENPHIYRERSECFGFPAVEEIHCCPYCDGPLVSEDYAWMYDIDLQEA